MKASIFYILALFRNHLTLTTKLPFLTFFAAKQAAQKMNLHKSKVFSFLLSLEAKKVSFSFFFFLFSPFKQRERKERKKGRKEEAPRLNLDDNFVEKT